MWSKQSGIQGGTVKKILLAWALTLPASVALAAVFYTLARWLIV
jgi:phosphate/sulfate permease